MALEPQTPDFPETPRPARILVDVATFVPTKALELAELYRAGEATAQDLLDEISHMLGSELSILALILALAEARSTDLEAAASTPPLEDGEISPWPLAMESPARFARMWNEETDAIRALVLDGVRHQYLAAHRCLEGGHLEELIRLRQQLAEANRYITELERAARGADWPSVPEQRREPGTEVRTDNGL